MSKAFTQDDSSSDPVIVPARAPLPPGVPNYVTGRGRRLLEEERRDLLDERRRLAEATEDEDADEYKTQMAVITQRLRDLTERITTARTVAPPGDGDRTVRFGATVTLRTIEGDAPGRTRRIKLVGVDEAGESASLVAFCAPVAKAILGHEAGERVTRPTRSGDEILEIVDISYEDADGT